MFPKMYVGVNTFMCVCNVVLCMLLCFVAVYNIANQQT